MKHPASDWTLHHVGVAVDDLERAIEVHRNVFGQELLGGPYHDPLQQVSVCFMQLAGSASQLELVAPSSDESPIANWLRKQIGAYHVCYEVDDLGAALEHVRSKRCTVVSGPTPAIAFGGRRIAWMFTATRQLTELLER